jgi:hypothetical protein
MTAAAGGQDADGGQGQDGDGASQRQLGRKPVVLAGLRRRPPRGPA